MCLEVSSALCHLTMSHATRTRWRLELVTATESVKFWEGLRQEFAQATMEPVVFVSSTRKLAQNFYAKTIFFCFLSAANLWEYDNNKQHLLCQSRLSINVHRTAELFHYDTTYEWGMHIQILNNLHEILHWNFIHSFFLFVIFYRWVKFISSLSTSTSVALLLVNVSMILLPCPLWEVQQPIRPFVETIQVKCVSFETVCFHFLFYFLASLAFQILSCNRQTYSYIFRRLLWFHLISIWNHLAYIVFRLLRKWLRVCKQWMNIVF